MIEALNLVNEFIEHESFKGFTEETIIRKKKSIESFLKFTGYQYKRILKDDIDSYLDELKSRGLCTKRINHVIYHLKQFYKYLVDTGMILLNPMESIETLKDDRVIDSNIFTEEEIKELFKATLTHRRRKNLVIMKRDRAILELLYSTGLRVRELVSLDMNDLDFPGNEVTVFNTKGHRDRIVPIGGSSITALKKYISIRHRLIKQDKETVALFLSRQGNRIAGVSIRRMIARRKVEANITAKGSTHAFRRSCAAHMLKNGAPLPLLQRLLGHADIQTTEKYTPVNSNDLREAFMKYHPRADW